MDALVRIKRLVIARRVQFTLKAERERLRDGLEVEDVLESNVSSNGIKLGKPEAWSPEPPIPGIAAGAIAEAVDHKSESSS